MTVGGGSTDYGDISYVMPLLQFHTGGMCGSGHNPNYDVANEDTAYLLIREAVCADYLPPVAGWRERSSKTEGRFPPAVQ